MSRLLAFVFLLLGTAFAAAAHAAQKPEGLAWCYRSLADVVCYVAPDPGHENRFVGAYPFRPDTAQRLLIEEGRRRRAAALARRRWPPVPPGGAGTAVRAPAVVPAAPGQPAHRAAKNRGKGGTPAKAKAAAHPPPLPVPRPPPRHAAVDRKAAPQAPSRRASPVPPPSCGTEQAGRPRPLLEVGSGCNAKSD